MEPQAIESYTCTFPRPPSPDSEATTSRDRLAAVHDVHRLVVDEYQYLGGPLHYQLTCTTTPVRSSACSTCRPWPVARGHDEVMLELKLAGNEPFVRFDAWSMEPSRSPGDSGDLREVVGIIFNLVNLELAGVGLEVVSIHAKLEPRGFGELKRMFRCAGFDHHRLSKR